LVRAQARKPAADANAPALITVTGGQRGVGTTTVALNRAAALALQGRQTILVDADLDRGAIARLCKLAERGSIVDVLSGRRSIHEVLARGPAGLQVLPGAGAPGEAQSCSAMDQGRLIAELRGLGNYVEAVVIDTGSARNSFVRRFWQAADVRLVVSTPDPIAIIDCYATIKVLLASDASMAVHTLVNRSPDATRADEVQTRIAAACRRFLGARARAAGHLPDERLIEDAAPLGTPFVLSAPRSESTWAVQRLAERLWLECRGQSDAAADKLRAPLRTDPNETIHEPVIGPSA
jgi:flagellar biosynthesis protein FlhG